MSFPPGPRHPALFTLMQWMRRPFSYFDECALRHGEAFTLHFPASPPVCTFAHPEAIRDIFGRSPELMLSGAYKAELRPFLGEESLLVLDGEQHAWHRRLLAPLFHADRVHRTSEKILAIANEALDRWPRGKAFSVYAEMAHITLRVLLQTIFGLSEGERLDKIVGLVTELVDSGTNPLLALPFLQVDLGPLSPWGRFLRRRKAGDAILEEEIAHRRAEGFAHADDVVARLLEARDEAGRGLEGQALRDEIVTLIISGHETTATALTWALGWILNEADLVARLQSEIASSGLVPERVLELPLLDATIREALRVKPVVPSVGRILAQPARVGGFDLPAGTAVIASVYLAGRRPERFHDPSRFEPERFLRHRFSPDEYFPFGGGGRRCIGMTLALHEMKLVLATVLSRATLRLLKSGPPEPVRRGVTLTPRDGLPVILDRLD